MDGPSRTREVEADPTSPHVWPGPLRRFGGGRARGGSSCRLGSAAPEHWPPVRSCPTSAALRRRLSVPARAVARAVQVLVRAAHLARRHGAHSAPAAASDRDARVRDVARGCPYRRPSASTPTDRHRRQDNGPPPLPALATPPPARPSPSVPAVDAGHVIDSRQCATSSMCGAAVCRCARPSRPGNST